MKKSAKLANAFQSDRLFSLSCTGTALATMFPPFHEKLGLPMLWLHGIDSVLALSVVVCTILLSYHLTSMCEKLKGLEPSEQEKIALELEIPERLRKGGTKFDKIVGAFFVLCSFTGGVIGGIYYVSLACRSPDIYRTTTVLGYVLCGASMVIVGKIFDRFFKSKILD